MNDQTIEGWYLDPYGIHEQRWMSAGSPTSLVRDAGTEANDEPPDRPPSRPFVPAQVVESTLGRDLLRADDIDNEPSRDLAVPMRMSLSTPTPCLTTRSPQASFRPDLRGARFSNHLFSGKCASEPVDRGGPSVGTSCSAGRRRNSELGLSR